jgi:hypothetical protein
MKKLVALIAFLGVFASQGISDTPSKDRSEFIFARVQFNMDPGWILETREAPWHHDYPYSEDLFLTMVKEVTGIYTSNESYEVVQLDSEDIFKYPFLYVSEPGFMRLTPKETTNLQKYLSRGGFMMFDDFRGADLTNLRRQMKKVFPERDMFKLDISHPIFHSFYDIDSLVMDPPYWDPVRFTGGPEFWGMSDDKGRLIMIGNQNNDFGEFWEWVDKAEKEFQPAAKSVRLGINYLIYAMTH